MTFLQYLSKSGKLVTIALIIIGCIAGSVLAQKTGTQTQGKRYGDAGFVGEVTNLNVVNADVRDILSYFTEQYGINFVIDKSVQKVPVTVNISDVPWNTALDAILRSQELGVQVNGPILRVAASKTIADEGAVEEKKRENQLDASPLYTEFIRLNYAQASGSAGGPGFTTGTSGGASGGSAGGDGLLPIIKRRVSRRGSIETDAKSNSLIITDVKENIDAIRQLVAILDQPEAQVEVEARVVIATRDFSRDIGIQLSGAVFGNRIGDNGGAVGGSLPSAGTNPTGGAGATTGGVLGSSPNNNLASQLANTVIGLTTGRFGTAQINLLLTAGEKKGQAKTIATPRVTMLNNEKGIMESGQQIPIVTSQTGTGGGAAVFTTTYVSVPLKLEVTPLINDAGTVLLDLVVENSSVSSTSASGGAPGINTQRTKTKMMVPDGGTTVVGGALIDVEGEDNFRTPGLHKIPVLGNLFKRKAIARTTSEVLFFITPRIIRPDLQNSQTADKTGVSNRPAAILQPVPLGNPPSNSGGSENVQQPVTIPVVPAVQVGNPVKP